MGASSKDQDPVRYTFDVGRDGLDELAALLRREAITITCMGASLFRSFVDVLDPAETFPALRLIRLGSEPVRSQDLELYRRHFSPHCRLVNGLASGEMKPVQRSYSRAIRRYRPRPYAGKMTLLVSDELYRRSHPHLGWSDLVSEGLEIHKAPGDHTSYIRGHIDVTAMTIPECLEKAAAAAPHRPRSTT